MKTLFQSAAVLFVCGFVTTVTAYADFHDPRSMAPSEYSPYIFFDSYASLFGEIESYGQGDAFDAAAAQKFYDDRAVKGFVTSWHYDASKALVLPPSLNPTDAPKLSGELVSGDWSGEADFNFTLGNISAGSPNLSLFQELNPIGFDYDSEYPTLHADQNGDFVHMVAFDVTDLFQAMFRELFEAGLVPQIESAYMLAWETGREDGRRDFSYSDYNHIVINVSPNYPPVPAPVVTPEPATLLVFGFGIAGVCVSRCKKRKS